MRTSRARAGHGVCASGASQQHHKTQRIRALTRGSPPTTVISPKSSDSWVSSHARHLTKDLGAYSPREIPMRKSMSVHELYNYALLVGSLSLSLSNTGNKTPCRAPKAPSQSQAASRGRTPHQEHNTLYKAGVSPELSPELTPHELFFPLAGFVAPRASLFSLTPHGLLARQRGAPEHRASRALTSLSLTHPPALSSPDSGIPKRRCYLR